MIKSPNCVAFGGLGLHFVNHAYPFRLLAVTTGPQLTSKGSATHVNHRFDRYGGQR